MHFIEGLPNANEFSTIWVVINRMTKYSHFIRLGHPYSAKSVALLFIKHIFKLHGLPQSKVSDKDRTFFTSTFWKELFLAQ